MKKVSTLKSFICLGVFRWSVASQRVVVLLWRTPFFLNVSFAQERSYLFDAGDQTVRPVVAVSSHDTVPRIVMSERWKDAEANAVLASALRDTADEGEDLEGLVASLRERLPASCLDCELIAYGSGAGVLFQLTENMGHLLSLSPTANLQWSRRKIQRKPEQHTKTLMFHTDTQDRDKDKDRDRDRDRKPRVVYHCIIVDSKVTEPVQTPFY